MSHVEAFQLDMGECSGGLVRTNPIKHKDFAIFEVWNPWTERKLITVLNLLSSNKSYTVYDILLAQPVHNCNELPFSSGISNHKNCKILVFNRIQPYQSTWTLLHIQFKCFNVTHTIGIIKFWLGDFSAEL